MSQLPTNDDFNALFGMAIKKLREHLLHENDKCQHLWDGRAMRSSNPLSAAWGPDLEYKCKKCGEFYK